MVKIAKVTSGDIFKEQINQLIENFKKENNVGIGLRMKDHELDIILYTDLDSLKLNLTPNDINVLYHKLAIS